MAQMNFIGKLVRAWDWETVTNQYLNSKQKGGAMEKTLREISDEFDKLRREVRNVEREIALDQVQKDYEGITIEEATELPEESWIMTQAGRAFDLSRLDQPLLERFHKELRVAQGKKAKFIRERKGEVQDKLDQVDDLEKLLAENQDGDAVISLVNPYTPEYYTHRQEVLQEFENTVPHADGKAEMRAAKQKLIEGLTEVDDAIDIRYLVEDLEDGGEFSSREEYISHLKEKYGEKIGKQAAEQALAAWEKYQEVRRAKLDNVNAEIFSGTAQKKDGETDEEYRERLMQQFDERNSPLTALEEFRRGEVQNAFNMGHRNLHFVGKPDHKDSKYFDRLTEEERQAADALRDLFAELMDELPQHRTRGKQNNFLPVVRKDWREFMMSDGMKAATSEIWSNFTDDFLSAEDVGIEKGETYPDAFQGLTDKKNLPVRYLSDARIEEAERTPDIQKMTDQFLSMVAAYKFMKEVRPTVEIMGRVIHEMTGEAEPGLTKGTNAQQNVIRESMRHTLNSLMFESARKEELNPNTFVTQGGIMDNVRANRERREIQKEHQELKEKLERGEITQSEYEEQVEELDERMKELSGRRFSFMRFVESTLGQLTMLQGLGWSPLSGLNNMLFGLMANSIEASSGQFFDDGDLVNAFGTYLSEWREGSQKIPHLMQTFNIFFEVSELAFGKKAQEKGSPFMQRLLENPMLLMNETETFIQGIAMVAYLHSHKVQVTENGQDKEISMYEAFNEKGKWDEERFGKNPEFQSLDGEREIDRHGLRIVQLIKRIHGNFDTSSPMNLKWTALGRMASMFKTWVFEGFSYRFGKEQYDSHLEEYVKGTYRSSWQLFLDKDVGISEAMQVYRANDPEAKAKELGVDPTDAFNLRRALRELKFWAMTSMAMLVMQAAFFGEDDEEEYKPALRTMHNLLFRLNQDTTFYLTPGTGIELLNEPFPAMATAIDLGKAVKSTGGLLTDPQSASNVRDQWMKQAPLFSSMYSLQWMSENSISEIE